MSDIITIAQFKALDSGKNFTSCIQVKVIQVEAPKEGVSNNGHKWKRQSILISDASGEMKLGIFDKNIGKLLVDKTYKICELGVDIYMGKNVPRMIPKTTINQVSKFVEGALQQQQEEIQPTQNKSIPEEFTKFCEDNAPRLKAFRIWLRANDAEAKSNDFALGMLTNNLNLQWIHEKVEKK